MCWTLLGKLYLYFALLFIYTILHLYLIDIDFSYSTYYLLPIGIIIIT